MWFECQINKSLFICDHIDICTFQVQMINTEPEQTSACTHSDTHTHTHTHTTTTTTNNNNDHNKNNQHSMLSMGLTTTSNCQCHVHRFRGGGGRIKKKFRILKEMAFQAMPKTLNAFSLLNALRKDAIYTPLHPLSRYPLSVKFALGSLSISNNSLSIISLMCLSTKHQ